jgi:tetratricopeptide (TPR) repeat protein
VVRWYFMRTASSALLILFAASIALLGEARADGRHGPRSEAVRLRVAAEEAERRGEFVHAVELFKSSSGADTDEISFLKGLAFLERKAGMFRSELDHLREVARVRNFDFESVSDLGIAYTDLGVSEGRKENFDLAIACYRRAVMLEPASARAWYNAAIAFLHRGNTGQAKRCLQNAIRLDPKESRAFYSLGNIAKSEGDLLTAGSFYKKSLRIDPAFDEAWYNLGNIYETAGAEDEAGWCFRKARQLKPEHYRAFMLDGRLRVVIKDNAFTGALGIEGE